jgi:hypothetical protein
LVQRTSGGDASGNPVLARTTVVDAVYLAAAARGPNPRIIRKGTPMATWLITGASSGLGFSLAEHVLQHGEQVVLTARTLAPMAELAAQYPATARSFGLDVIDADQRCVAIRFAEEQFVGRSSPGQTSRLRRRRAYPRPEDPRVIGRPLGQPHIQLPCGQAGNDAP